MGEGVAKVLAECLDEIERGDSTLADCMAKHPEFRDELERLFVIVGLLESAPMVTPRPAFRYAARARLLNLLPQQQSTRLSDWLSSIWLKRPHLVPGFALVGTPARVLTVTALLVMMVAAGTGGAVYASGDALPGDGLYPIKLAFEDARLALSDNEGDAHFYLVLAEKRVHEIKSLAGQERFGDVGTAVRLFERHVAEAVEGLEYIATQDAEGAQTFALLLDQALSRSSHVLADLLLAVPDEFQPSIRVAASVTRDRRNALTSSFPGILPAKTAPTPKPTGEDLPAAASSPTSTPTEEQSASTLVPTSTASIPPTPTGTAMSVDPPAPTSTPMPTNRPEPSVEPPVVTTVVPPGLTNTPQPPGLTNTPQPPGLTNTPQPPGLTNTPQPPGQTKTPQPPGQTKTPQPPGQTRRP